MADNEKPEPIENKTERVQLLMSPSEVEAIDDWGFSHRIRTRAEAIRRLASMGLAFENTNKVLISSVEALIAKVSGDNINDQLDTIVRGLKELTELRQSMRFDFSLYRTYETLYRTVHDEPMPYSKIDDVDERSFASRMVQEYKDRFGKHDVSDNEIRNILIKKLDDHLEQQKILARKVEPDQEALATNPAPKVDRQLKTRQPAARKPRPAK